jgi:hypothetical protein
MISAVLMWSQGPETGPTEERLYSFLRALLVFVRPTSLAQKIR